MTTPPPPPAAVRAAEKIYRDEANCYEGRINQRAKAGDPIAQRVLDDAVQIITSEYAPMLEACESALKACSNLLRNYDKGTFGGMANAKAEAALALLNAKGER